MSKIDALFESLKRQNQKAFIPFLTAGDPDLEFTRDALVALASAGAAICEVGVPYSDPIADGPVIQASYSRALERGVTVEGVLDAASQAAHQTQAPLVTMVSYSIVHRVGADAYLQRAADAGIQGLIVPDLPMEEGQALAERCAGRALSLIQLITPTTTPKRAASIIEATSGFIYCVSVTGITGERSAVPEDLAQRIQWLRSQTELPICVGFGISEPDHVRNIAPLADGVIVGSAYVRRIANADDKSAALADICEFTSAMLAAL